MKTLIALVGMKHRGTEEFVAALPDGEQLTLVREPTNKFDPRAVMVFARGQHVGYLKQSQNQRIASWMDALRNAKKENVSLPAVLKLKPEKDRTWPMVEVDQ